MDFAWSPEDLAFKEELEAFLEKELPPFLEEWADDDLEASRGVMGVMDKRKAWQNKLNERSNRSVHLTYCKRVTPKRTPRTLCSTWRAHLNTF